MKNTTWITSCWLSLALLGFCCETHGQQPAEKAEPVAPEPSAAVRAIIDSDPTTVEELVVAASQLAVHDQPQLAREMLARVLAAKPDAKTCHEFIQQHGSGMLLRLQGNRLVAPHGGQVTKLILEAADKAIRDPARLAALIEQLKNPSSQQRGFAAADLAAAGMDAVPLIVKSLSDPAQQQFHANYRAALARFGEAAAAPMLGLMESSDAALKTHAIAVLGQIKAPHTAIYLIGSLASRREPKSVREAAYRSLLQLLDNPPRRAQAEQMLKDRVTTMMGGNHRLAADIENRVILWHFNERTKQLAPKTYHHDDAQAVLAARLARDLHLATPGNVEHRQIYLTAMLKAAALVTGRDKPLATSAGSAFDIAATFKADAVEAVLADALKNNQPEAAAAAAQILGQIGTPELLYRNQPQPSPLAQAARHRDPRVRFSAAEAIVHLKPTQPFAGSSYVPEALGYFAGSSGQRRVLVAHRSIERARVLAGELAALGFEADVAGSGRDLMRMAVTSPDYEMLFISMTIDRPTVSYLLQEIRRDTRTSQVAVGLLATEASYRRAERIARSDSVSVALPWPPTPGSGEYYAKRMGRLLERNQVEADVRLERAKRSLELLAELADGSDERQSIYNLARQQPSMLRAVLVPQLSESASAVLGKLGTPAAQRKLIDVASQTLFPLSARRHAARAFSESVRKHGVLLTKDEILRQYERYNASEKLSKETQIVLALVLDSIESKTRKAE
jgi:hypothetical protein